MLRSILASSLLIFIGCKESPAKNQTAIESHIQSESRDFEEAIQLILDVPDFQMWLHGEVPERVPLKIFMNDFVKKEYDLQKFGEQVRIVDSVTIKNEHIEDAIRIRLLETEKDTVRYSLYHRLEGAIMHGRLYRLNSQWNIIVDSIGEI